jgi:hypothetical protein
MNLKLNHYIVWRCFFIKTNQAIAFLILMPMLIFTFFITIKCEGFEPMEDGEQIIREYFYLKNEKELSHLSKLLENKDDISELELQMKHIEKISLTYIKEETNESILKAYLKDNKSIANRNLKVYKVNYEVSYNNTSEDKYKNGVYESWFFLNRKNSYSKWFIDICDI